MAHRARLPLPPCWCRCPGGDARPAHPLDLCSPARTRWRGYRFPRSKRARHSMRTSRSPGVAMRTDLGRRLARIVAGILLGTSAGCLDPVDPAQVEVAEIRVVFGAADSADTVQVRGTTRARAVALAREGYDLGRTDFIFSSSDTTVATVDASGVVRGVRPGTAVVTATLPDGRSGDGSVQVVSSTIAYTIPVGASP